MAGLLHDLRYALRQLGRSPVFTATAILMLALGICATSTALSWIEGTMLNPVPGARATGRLVTVMRGTWNPSPAPPFSYPDYRDLRDTNRTFSGILGYHHEWATLTGGDSPQRIYAAQVSGNYFNLLGIEPALGRFFRVDEEARLGGVPYVVLGYSLWKNRSGATRRFSENPSRSSTSLSRSSAWHRKGSSGACPPSVKICGRRLPPAPRPGETTRT